MSLDELCREVENVAGWRMCTTGDFDRLSALIMSRIHERISPSTLKRIWGYLDENVQPRKFTLDLLCRFLGYASFEQFCQQKGMPQSDFLFSEQLAASSMDVGERIQLDWAPDRQGIIKYLGDGHFVVEEAKNTKLHVGDTFVCHMFLQHEPLYLSMVVHDGGKPVSYVAGKKSGILWNVL